MTSEISFQHCRLRPDRYYLVDRDRREVLLHGYPKFAAPSAKAPLILLSGTQIASDARFKTYAPMQTLTKAAILDHWAKQVAQSRLGWRSAAASISATIEAFEPATALTYLRKDRPCGQAISEFYDRAIEQLEELLSQRHAADKTVVLELNSDALCADPRER